VLCSLVRSASAQVRPALAVELQLTDRWLDGHQQPGFTPFAHFPRQWMYLDSVRARGGSSPQDSAWTFYLTDGKLVTADRALFSVDAGGRLLGLDAWRPDSPFTSMRGRDSANFVQLALRDFGGGGLALRGMRAWELVHPFHPRRLAPGERWTDTLRFHAEEGGCRQALSAVVVSTLIGDTTVGGQRQWVVSDSAGVTYEEHALVEERTLDTLVAVDRTVTGAVRGRMVYDPALHLFRTRDDSAELTGSVTLRYPDGRSFAEPTRYQRRRRWTVYESTAYALRMRALQGEREAVESPGMVIVATDSVQSRLSAGDTLVRDSLVRAWQSSTDPDERARLFDLLRLVRGGDMALVHRLDSLRTAAGDTAFILEMLAGAGDYTGRPRRVDAATMRRLIDVMSDPGRPFAFGMDRDPFYENLANSLVSAPPAAVPDTAKWPCMPAACRMLAQEWPSAAEPRLRQLGLVARFVLDPRRWGDTLEARAVHGAPLLADALFLERGVGATWPAASHAPIPVRDADWRAWLEWMNGSNPQFAQSGRSASRAFAPVPYPRFEESHRAAVRFTEARTGRHIAAELREGFAAARSDSARLVYEYMLLALGAYRPVTDSVVAHFRSRSAPLMTLARHELPWLFDPAPPPADSATTETLLDRLIGMNFAGQRPWWHIDVTGVLAPTANDLPPREVANEHTVLLADSIPPALRATWAGRVPMTTMEEWKRGSIRTGGTLLTFSGVERVGPFVRLGISSSGRVTRRADQAPWLYLADTTYLLMLLDGEWVIVDYSWSIT
jgi:hypothetical protein